MAYSSGKSSSVWTERSPYAEKMYFKECSYFLKTVMECCCFALYLKLVCIFHFQFLNPPHEYMHFFGDYNLHLQLSNDQKKKKSWLLHFILNWYSRGFRSWVLNALKMRTYLKKETFSTVTAAVVLQPMWLSQFFSFTSLRSFLGAVYTFRCFSPVPTHSFAK